MSPGALSRTVLLIEGAVVGAALALIFGHALWLNLEARRTRPRLLRGRRALAEYLDGDREEREVAATLLAGLPRRVQRRVAAEASESMRAGNTAGVGDIARRLGLVREARRWCRSRRWSRRALGAHLLTLWGEAEVDAALLTDRHPVVRTRAIEWAGEHPSPELVELVLERLVDPSLMCRWTAQDALLRAGAAATAPLAGRLASATHGPAIELLLGLAARRPDASFYDASLRLAGDDRPAVRAGAAATLGGLGGTEGTAVLQALLRDPDPRPRAAAADGLGRLRHWPAAAPVGALLGDPSWEVRRAAGEALARMGAPGTLLLGHYARSPETETAEAARYAVDVAELRRATVTGPQP